MMEAKVDNITNDLKALSKDAKELAHEAKNHALNKSGELNKKYVEFLDSALSAAKVMPAAAAKKTKAVAATTDDFVNHNPWRAVTISAGLGLVLGFLFSRK